MDLRAEARERVVERLRVAAMEALFRDGPTATVDAVAELAGVGRATVFRHFATRDELLAAGLQHAYDGFSRAVPAWQRGEPAEEWLRTLVAGIVARSTRGGAGYVRTLLDPGDGALAAVVASRLPRREQVNESIARDLWRSHGRTGRVPRRVVDGVALLTGPHATWALHVDLGLPEAQVVERLVWLLRSLVVEGAAS